MWPFKWKLVSSAVMWYVVLFIMLYKVVLTFNVDESLVCDHSNKSYWAVLCCKCCANFKVCRWCLSIYLTYLWHFKRKQMNFRLVLFIMLYRAGITFKFVNETLVRNHSNESYWEGPSCGTVYYAVQVGSNFQVCG